MPMARARKKWIAVMAGMGVAAVLVVVFWPEESEPEHKGKRLSEWLGTYDSYFTSTRFPTMSEMEEAADAVRHLGTNSLPVLLRWISIEPWPWRRRLQVTVQRLPGPLKGL